MVDGLTKGSDDKKGKIPTLIEERKVRSSTLDGRRSGLSGPGGVKGVEWGC